MSSRKFKHGRAVQTVHEAVGLILADRWLYFRHKPMSPKWLMNWSICQISGAVHHGVLRVADRVDAGERASS